MATIPGYEPQRAPSSRQQGVVTMDTRAATTGTDAVAGDLGKMIETRDRNEVAKARNKFLMLKTEQDAAYNDDEDFKTIPERYGKVMDEGFSDLVMSITDDNVREQFQGEIEVDLVRGKERIKGIAGDKHKDRERSTINEEFSILQKAAEDDAGDPVWIYNAMRRRLTAAAEDNIISHQEAQAQGDLFRTNVATNKLKAMEAQDRLDALSAPWAANIPVHITKVLRDEAKAELKGQKAYNTALGMREMTRDEGLAKIREIKDKDEYELTRSKFLQMQTDDLTAIQVKQQELYTNLLPDIRNGEVRLDDLNVKAMDLSPAQYNNLRAEEDFLAKKTAGMYVPTYSDEHTKDILEKLIFNDQEGRMLDARQYYGENSAKLSVADKRYYNNKFTAIKGAEASAAASKAKQFKGVETTKAKMDRFFKQYSVGDVGHQSQMWTNLQQWAEYFYDKTGENPDDKKIDDRIMSEYFLISRDPDAIFFTDDVYVHEMSADERADFFDAYERLKHIDPRMSREAVISRYENMLRGRLNAN